MSGPLFERYPGHTVMAITMLAGTIPLVAWAWTGLRAVDWIGLGPTVWAGVVFSSVVPLYLGFWIWNWAVAKKGLQGLWKDLPASVNDLSEVSWAPAK